MLAKDLLLAAFPLFYLNKDDILSPYLRCTATIFFIVMAWNERASRRSPRRALRQSMNVTLSLKITAVVR